MKMAKMARNSDASSSDWAANSCALSWCTSETLSDALGVSEGVGVSDADVAREAEGVAVSDIGEGCEETVSDSDETEGAVVSGSGEGCVSPATSVTLGRWMGDSNMAALGGAGEGEGESEGLTVPAPAATVSVAVGLGSVDTDTMGDSTDVGLTAGLLVGLASCSCGGDALGLWVVTSSAAPRVTPSIHTPNTAKTRSAFMCARWFRRLASAPRGKELSGRHDIFPSDAEPAAGTMPLNYGFGECKWTEEVEREERGGEEAGTPVTAAAYGYGYPTGLDVPTDLRLFGESRCCEYGK